MAPLSRRGRANVLLLITAVIWGFAFAAQVQVGSLGPFTVNATRFAMGAVTLLPVIVWNDRRQGVDRDWSRHEWRSALWPGALIGLFLFGGSGLQQIGIGMTTAGNASFVTGLYVVLVPLIGIFFGHRPDAKLWIGVALTVTGLYLMTMTHGIAAMNRGDALCLAGTIFWAAQILTVGHFVRRIDALRLTVSQFVWNAIYATIAAFAFDARPFQGIGDVIWPMLFIGVMSSGVAFTLQVVAQKDAVASEASLIMSLETVFGAVGGALVLGQLMPPIALVGAAFMLAGIILAQLPGRGDPDPTPQPMPEPPSTVMELDL